MRLYRMSSVHAVAESIGTSRGTSVELIVLGVAAGQGREEVQARGDEGHRQLSRNGSRINLSET